MNLSRYHAACVPVDHLGPLYGPHLRTGRTPGRPAYRLPAALITSPYGPPPSAAHWHRRLPRKSTFLRRPRPPVSVDLRGARHTLNTGATPYENPALLLFALPLLFTLQKLLLLFRFGERSHQLAVEQQGRPPGTRLQKYTRQSLTYLLLSLFRTFVSSEFSRSMSSPISCAI